MNTRGLLAEHQVTSIHRPVALALALTAAALVMLSVLADIGVAGTTPDSHANTFFQWFRSLVDLNLERNLPTWFASLLWAGLGAVSLVAASLARRRTGWVLVGAVALLASLDEYVGLHERLNMVTRPATRILFGAEMPYAWVIIGGPLAVIVGLMLLPFVRSLPSCARQLILAGGAAFLLGSVGTEIVASFIVQVSTAESWAYRLAVVVEESLEMAGVILALTGVLTLFTRQTSGDGPPRYDFHDPHDQRLPTEVYVNG